MPSQKGVIIGIMRLVVQRVGLANVSVAGKTIGKIDKGLFVLIGIGRDDNLKDANYLASKLAKLRIMADKAGKMNLSIKDSGSPVLVVSQFTLFADTSKGNRPSFVNAAEPKKAEKIYNYFVEKLRNLGVRVETGRFGEYMEIQTRLDGPVTIII